MIDLFRYAQIGIVVDVDNEFLHVRKVLRDNMFVIGFSVENMSGIDMGEGRVLFRIEIREDRIEALKIALSV